MRYAAILTSFVGIAALTTPAVAETPAGAPAPGIYVRFVTWAGASGGAVPTACAASGALVSEQNASSTRPTWHPVQLMKGDIEQVLNIGSQSTGAGAGKVTFNPFSITMPSSSLDATLTDYAASGKPLCDVDLMAVTSQGPTQLYKLRLAAVKTISWTVDSKGNSTSNYTFEYGGLIVVNQSYTVAGVPNKSTAKGWNRVLNTTMAVSSADSSLKQMMP